MFFCVSFCEKLRKLDDLYLRWFVPPCTHMNDPSDPYDLDFTSFDPLPAITRAQTQNLAPTVAASSSQLKANGFYITIPRRNVNARITTRKPLILIIDDDISIRKILEKYLGEDGYETRLAGNCDEIMHEISRQPLPDLILCDVEMPDANGFDLLNKFRHSKVLGNVPVVMLTRRNEKKDIVLGITLGAAGYITKPAKIGVLKEAMRQLLR